MMKKNMISNAFCVVFTHLRHILIANDVRVNQKRLFIYSIRITVESERSSSLTSTRLCAVDLKTNRKWQAKILFNLLWNWHKLQTISFFSLFTKECECEQK